MAATGNPPPSPFAIVVRSGVTPKYSWAPPRANRNPVMTSSKMSSAPCRRVCSRSSSRYPGAGRMQPVLNTAGSVITAATWSPRSSMTAVKLSGSFQVSTMSVDSSSAGTPGPDATGRGAGRPGQFGVHVVAPVDRVLPAVVVPLEADDQPTPGVAPGPAG